MIRYAEAMAEILGAASARTESFLSGRESVDLALSVGRRFAEDACVPWDVPELANSAMDGYAVVAERTANATPDSPVRLPVVGSLAAGNAPPVGAGDGAWEIMTGAPVPEGTDAVIRVEDTRREGNEVSLFRAVSCGDSVRYAGDDMRRGDVIAREGCRILPGHVLAMGTFGKEKIIVRRRPRIGIVSTGSELVPLGPDGGRPGPGRIYNSTAPYLVAALGAAGCDVTHHGCVGDDPKAFFEKMRTVLSGAPDIVVTTGAVSMGKYDFVTEAIRDLKARISFHKVAIRPGKPLLFAEFPGGPVFFGLPGNPVSTAVGSRFFIEPYARALQKAEPELPIRLRLSRTVKKPEGLRCFYKARADFARGDVLSLPGQESFRVAPLLSGNGWMVLPETGNLCHEGTEVEWYPWHDEAGAPLAGGPKR